MQPHQFFLRKGIFRWWYLGGAYIRFTADCEKACALAALFPESSVSLHHEGQNRGRFWSAAGIGIEHVGIDCTKKKTRSKIINIFAYQQ